jgi:alcohol sulfotransferase
MGKPLFFMDFLDRQRRVFKRLRKLSDADVVIVSHAKSGRTWLAAMISHVYHQIHGVDEKLIIRFDNFHRIHPEIPRVFFTHDNRKTRDKDQLATAKHFAGKKVILLVRDPRDVAVSAFFQSKRNQRKQTAQAEDGDTVDRQALYDYVTAEKLPLVIRFLKRWDQKIRLIDQSLVVQYENLRADPRGELARIMGFIGQTCPPAVIETAVDFASFDKLKAKEATRFFESDRLHPGNPDDPGSFKVRRGKVGGYRDYFTPAQLAHIDAMIAEESVERFGYRPATAPAEDRQEA